MSEVMADSNSKKPQGKKYPWGFLLVGMAVGGSMSQWKGRLGEWVLLEGMASSP
ncbi:MAG: hypothetical protein ACPGWR_12200 [Ardenticatenaceae bacterium]